MDPVSSLKKGFARGTGRDRGLQARDRRARPQPDQGRLPSTTVSSRNHAGGPGAKPSQHAGPSACSPPGPLRRGFLAASSRRDPLSSAAEIVYARGRERRGVPSGLFPDQSGVPSEHAGRSRLFGASIVMPYIYILRCRDHSLYTGIAKDVARRLAEHRAGRASRYTRVRLPVMLAWSRRVRSWSLALREEYRIKRLPRAAKLALVRKAPAPAPSAARGARREA